MQFGWNRFCDRLRDESGFDGVTPTLPMSQCHIYDLPLKCQIHQKSYRLSFRIHPAHISLQMAWNNFWIAKLWSKLEQGWCGDMFPWIPIREVLTLSATHLTTKLIFSETFVLPILLNDVACFAKRRRRLTRVTKHDIKTTMLSLQLSEDKYIGLLYRSIAIGEIANLFKFISFSPPSISFGFILINIQRKLYSKTSNTFARTKAFCNNIETSSYSNPINQAEKTLIWKPSPQFVFPQFNEIYRRTFFRCGKISFNWFSLNNCLSGQKDRSVNHKLFLGGFPWQKISMTKEVSLLKVICERCKGIMRALIGGGNRQKQLWQNRFWWKEKIPEQL